METIILWADGSWCREEDFWEYTWKSDDYIELEVPYYWDDDAIEAYLERR